MSLLVLTNPTSKLTKGSEFVRQALKSQNIVINPHTKELCVSFCIATLQYYRDTLVAGSLYNYLQ